MIPPYIADLKYDHINLFSFIFIKFVQTRWITQISYLVDFSSIGHFPIENRAGTRTLIGGGGVYSYIQVLPD